MNFSAIADTTEQPTSGFQEFIDTMAKFFASGLGKAILFVIVAIVGIILIKVLLKFLRKVSDKSKLEKTVGKFIYSIVKFILYVLYFITLLAIIGVPITSLVAILTAFTLGISMALQSTISNIVNGVILMANKPFKLGDLVEINGVKGTVIDINMFNTKLQTPDNEIITVSHNLTLDDNVIDYSHQETRRVAINVSVSYDSNVDKVKEVLWGVINTNEYALQEAENSVNLALMNASSLDFSVKVWCENDKYWECLYSLNEAIFKALNENGIEIPYQKLDINIKNEK